MAQLLARLGRHGALLDDQFWRPGGGGDLPGHVVDCGKIGFARLERRRAHANENGVGRANGLSAIRGESQPAGGGGAFHDVIQAGLVNRQAAGIQHGDAGGIVIRGDDFMPGLGKTTARHQSHITATNYGKAHSNLPRK